MTEDQVGTLAQEAMKLARTLASQTGDGSPGGGADPGTEGIGSHRTEACDYCPLCQLIAIVRDARPDVVEHLEAALVSLTLAARGVVDAWTQAPTGGRAGPHSSAAPDNSSTVPDDCAPADDMPDSDGEDD